MTMTKDFGAFEIHERIGSGGMATVYLGVQKSLGRKVVLKILRSGLDEDEKLVQRFEREARAAAMLKHENIVQIIDSGRHDDSWFIAMEFVEGRNLKTLMEEFGPPPLEIGLLLLDDLCSGLEHAHANRIVHRDIKPANIMLTPGGMLKIMDFGLARQGLDPTITISGDVVGTPAYMSPEQASGEAVDERSDIFSAGVVAYELLGGTRPFPGETYSRVRASILTVEPPPLASLNPIVPDEVAAIVHRMLQKDIAKRYPRVAHVRSDLDDAVAQIGLRRGRALLREYSQDPNATQEALRHKRLSRHLDQGIYFETMGLGKIDDALLEFRRALHLDPGNKVARDHMRKLEHEREHLRAVQTTTPPESGAPAGKQAASGVVDPASVPSARTGVASNAAGVSPSVTPAALESASSPAVSASARPRTPTAQPRGLESRNGARARTLLVSAMGALVVVLGIMAWVLAHDRKKPPSTGSIAITTDPPGAELALDDQPLPQASNTTLEDVEVGTHTVHAVMSGRLSQDQRVDVVGGQTASVTLVLPPEPVRLHAGAIFVTSDPSGALLFLDGRREGRSNDTLRSVQAGSHTVRAEKRGYLTQEKQVDVVDGSTASVSLTLARAMGTLELWARPYASFYVDDSLVGAPNSMSARIDVRAGHPHRVRIANPGHEARTWDTCRVDPGGLRRVGVNFLPGKLRVSTPGGSWAYIVIDGKDTGRTTPFEFAALEPRSYTVTLRRDGFVVDGGPQTVTVAAEETATAQFKLRPASK